MSSVDTIVAALRTAVDHLHKAVNHVRAARDMAEENRNLSERLGARDLVARFAWIADKAEELLAILVAGIDVGGRLIAQAEAIRGEVGGGTGGSGAAVPAVPSPPAVPEPAAPSVPITAGWRRSSEIPEHVGEAGGCLRPRPPEEEERFTTGILDGERVHSGGKDRSLAADLDHIPLSRPPVTFYEHVEAKVAARMRRENRQRAEVIIDNLPCGSVAEERDYVWGCDRILPSILPAGSTLVVWSTLDGGRSFWRRAYHGTGERIRG